VRLSYWRAVNLALDEALASDDRVVIFGQDVAAPGGPYGMTRGLLDKYGAERVKDAPISEQALMACATGAAMLGLRPIVEIMFFDFISLVMDQLVNQAAKYRFFLGEQRSALPVVVHTLYGGRANMGAQHSQSLEAWLCHVPGLQVAFPSTPQDAYDVMRRAVRQSDPVVVIEPIVQLRTQAECEIGGEPPEAGTARRVRTGDQITVVSYGPAVTLCEQALELTGISADLIDLRWLRPWDEGQVRESLRRTGRLVVVHDAVEMGGYGAELVAHLTAAEFWALDAVPRRVGASFSAVPVPSRQWSKILPTVERIAAALRASVADSA
jgi:pyruvate dehydrogenase E1 component beta subunit